MPGPRYRVLAVDLDGTLLNGRGRIDDVDLEAIETARMAGIEVIIATGRAYVESLSPLQQLDHRGFFIAASGSIMRDLGRDQTVARHVMPCDVVQDAVQAMVEHGHKALLLKDSHQVGYDYLAVGEGKLDPASEWWFNHLPVNVRFVDDLVDDEHPEETLRVAVVAQQKDLGTLASWFREHLDGRAFFHHWAAVTESAATGSSTHLLEVFDVQVSKWTMIADHCRRAGVPPGEVAAIGDGLNDVQMIEQSGLGIAMGNADERVLAVANRVTADHNSGGVAQAIDNILNGAW